MLPTQNPIWSHRPWFMLFKGQRSSVRCNNIGKPYTSGVQYTIQYTVEFQDWNEFPMNPSAER